MYLAKTTDGKMVLSIHEGEAIYKNDKNKFWKDVDTQSGYRAGKEDVYLWVVEGIGQTIWEQMHSHIFKTETFHRIWLRLHQHDDNVCCVGFLINTKEILKGLME